MNWFIVQLGGEGTLQLWFALYKRDDNSGGFLPKNMMRIQDSFSWAFAMPLSVPTKIGVVCFVLVFFKYPGSLESVTKKQTFFWVLKNTYLAVLNLIQPHFCF